MENKNYYSVITKCGHVGKGKYVEVIFPIIASSGKEAASIARKMPRVKRDNPNAIISVTKIDYEEYMFIKERNKNNSYLYCKNIQDQRASCPNIFEDVKELYDDEEYGEKRKERLTYIFRKRKSYERSFMNSDYAYAF